VAPWMGYPAYDNPPAAGFKLKVCIDGERKWLVPGVFRSNAKTPEGLIEGIIGWLQYIESAPCTIRGGEL